MVHRGGRARPDPADGAGGRAALGGRRDRLHAPPPAQPHRGTAARQLHLPQRSGRRRHGRRAGADTGDADRAP
ncbi:hypothetical protein G6F62_014732 [Rhizopus arrhizus]|nr:hypothetical protein G6F62_014732 [Rhizopus arrhizus]